VRAGRVHDSGRGLKNALRAVLVLLAGGAFALPAVAVAQAPNPLVPTFTQPTTSSSTTTPPPQVQTTATAGSGSGFTGSSAILIGISALVVLGGIGLYIWRDARRRAPKGHRTLAPIDAEGKRAGSKPRQKPRKLSQAEKRRRKRGRAR
jgi:hypothetical protein